MGDICESTLWTVLFEKLPGLLIVQKLVAETTFLKCIFGAAFGRAISISGLCFVWYDPEKGFFGSVNSENGAEVV